MSRRTGWSLLLAAVFGGTSIVLVAAIWGGTPLRQIPLTVLSMLVGAFLPVATGVIHQRATASKPQRSESTTAGSRQRDPISLRTKDANSATSSNHIDTFRPIRIRFIYEIEPVNRQTGIAAVVFTVLLLVCGIGLIMFGTQMEPATAEDADLFEGMTYFGMTALMATVLSALSVTNIIGGRIEIIVDDDKLTMKDRHSSVTIPWIGIERIWYNGKTGFLRANVPEMTKETHDNIYKMIGKGKYSPKGGKWDPNRPHVDICRINGLTTSAKVFYDAIERASGQAVENR
jgi:hypothetical protein